MLSRTASTLYWMSRYVERAENSARILDVAYRMSLLTKDPDLQDQEWFAPLNITGTLFPFSGRPSIAVPYTHLPLPTSDLVLHSVVAAFL